MISGCINKPQTPEARTIARKPLIMSEQRRKKRLFSRG
jgi:hypothetical protein